MITSPEKEKRSSIHYSQEVTGVPEGLALGAGKRPLLLDRAEGGRRYDAVLDIVTTRVPSPTLFLPVFGFNSKKIKIKKKYLN